MESAFKDWGYVEGLMESAYHEAALKMNLSDSELAILYVLNVHHGECNQSILYKEACMIKSTVNSAIRKMEQKELLYLTPGTGRNTQVFLTEKGRELMENTVYKLIEIENEIYNAWTPRERELFMKLNRDFAEKLKEKVGEL
ncbi:MarR family winged helix-turn-helix transcriptional regulator [Blautia glucerasea]|uniref:MarR family winged helix-turn-helix transcriptional regulator n=1 Tax=Blautia glucerasea TaxID=536633 RepID=UPI001D078BE7|nr:MarR family transcriptional regulator [Blautia glucerasea]MCB6545874.1 MarR family transcriptional regulator [Blautia glucerasea]